MTDNTLIEKAFKLVEQIQSERGAAPPADYTGDFREYWDETKRLEVNAVVKTVLEEMKRKTTQDEIEMYIEWFAEDNNINLEASNE